MTKDYRRFSTIERHNIVHILYAQIKAQLGEAANYTSKSYFYERISAEVKLSTRQVAYILNHTQYVDTANFRM